MNDLEREQLGDELRQTVTKLTAQFLTDLAQQGHHQKEAARHMAEAVNSRSGSLRMVCEMPLGNVQLYFRQVVDGQPQDTLIGAIEVTVEADA